MDEAQISRIIRRVAISPPPSSEGTKSLRGLLLLLPRSFLPRGDLAQCSPPPMSSWAMPRGFTQPRAHSPASAAACLESDRAAGGQLCGKYSDSCRIIKAALKDGARQRGYRQSRRSKEMSLPTRAEKGRAGVACVSARFTHGETRDNFCRPHRVCACVGAAAHAVAVVMPTCSFRPFQYEHGGLTHIPRTALPRDICPSSIRSATPSWSGGMSLSLLSGEDRAG